MMASSLEAHSAEAFKTAQKSYAVAIQHSIEAVARRRAAKTRYNLAEFEL